MLSEILGFLLYFGFGVGQGCVLCLIRMIKNNGVIRTVLEIISMLGFTALFLFVSFRLLLGALPYYVFLGYGLGTVGAVSLIIKILEKKGRDLPH